MKNQNLVIVTLVLAMFVDVFGITPVQAGTDVINEVIAVNDYLNTDGTLKLDNNVSGSLDLQGWDVNMDSQKGPVFTSIDYSSQPDLQTEGNWENLGEGVPMSFNGSIYTVVEINGSIIVGGSFTNLADNPEMDYIAKWDGVNWSPLGNDGLGNGSLNNSVNALAVDGNGNLYVGGDFTDIKDNGIVLSEADYVAKWDGTNWSTLGNNGAGNGALSSSVNALAVDGNGNLYVGGWFTNVNNNGIVLGAADRIAKWDGSSWSALGSNGSENGSLNSIVTSLVTDGNGNLYVGGWFTDVNNDGIVLGAADRIAKWDGMNWSALGSNGAGDGSLNLHVFTMTMDSNGNLYVGGWFSNVNNNGTILSAADYIVKWDGVNWSALGSNGSIKNQVLALTIDESGNLYVGGKFSNVDNLPAADYIAKWDGTNWSALGSNGAGNGSLNFYVNALTVDGSGKLFVGGDFTSLYDSANFINSPYFAAWDISSSNWYFPTNGSLQGAVNREIHAIVADGNGNIYVGGKFINLNGLGAADYVAKWDGTSWSALGSNGAGDGSLFSSYDVQNVTVNSLAVDGNGNLFVGGWFNDVNNHGIPVPEADSIAKWDGANWSALGSNDAGSGSLSGTVNALVVDENGNLYVGGNFGNVNNFGVILNEADFVAKWDGANWSAMGSNGAGNGSLNSHIDALAVDGNGNLYVGGGFTNVNNNGTPIDAADYIAKWDGVNWSALKDIGTNGPLNGIVTALVVDGSGNLYAGGSFSNVNNNGYTLLTADYVAKWDGTNWSALGSNGAADGALNSTVEVFGCGQQWKPICRWTLYKLEQQW